MSAQAALGYRRPMAVLELARHGSGGLFPLCPRCGSAMEREYQGYCDRCGQRLDWRGLPKARVIDRLRRAQPDAMTPIEAMGLLYELKQKLS